MEGTVVVRGLRQAITAFDRAETHTKREIRSTLREVGDIVKVEARSMFSRYGTAAAGATSYGGSRASHADTAAGFRTVVRRRGVSVEQSLRKTTGRHPEYGGLQMRHGLVPALDREAGRIESAFEHALDHVCDQFNEGG